jgi:type I restriction-modification system DNA methylase subunit
MITYEQVEEEHILSKEEKKKQFGEVFTPPELVNEILDQLPTEIWQDPTKTWLDNSCGDGAFLVEVKKRLMEGLAAWQPDPGLRERHILENQIYGVELQRDNWEKCRQKLGLSPTGNDGNIVCADGLLYNYTFLKDSNGGYVISDNTFDSLFQ